MVGVGGVDALGLQRDALQVQRLGAVRLRDAGVVDQHVSQTQSVFGVAPRRDGAGVRPTDHRRDGRHNTGWTKPQRDPSMGIRSSEACREQVVWPGGGPWVRGRSRRWGVAGPPVPVWWMNRAHDS